MMITEPGIYTDLTVDEYFADPCPSPSFTQSLAKIMLAKSPLHAWNAHPRLNPDFVRDEDTKFNLGSAAHSILLGRGKEIVVCDFENWMTKAARLARDNVYERGGIPVLGHQYAKADRMVRAAREQLPWLDIDRGCSEVCLAWQEHDVWCRQLIDWMDRTHTIIIDYKTTTESAAPEALPRKMVTDGWHIQAAMTERALAILSPENAGIRRYRYIVQETDPPYQLMVATIGDAALAFGARQLDYAIATWAECISVNRFPGYPNQTMFEPEIPAWAESQWLNWEIHDAARERGMITEIA